jgi:hypothetical protein
MRKDLDEAKKKVIIANEKEAMAYDLVQSLRLEVNQLKRNFQHAKDTSAPVGISHTTLMNEADNEVNEMMMYRGVTSDTIYYEREDLATKFTPFQEWKMQKLIWAPDTPAASEYVDNQTLEVLLSESWIKNPKNQMKDNDYANSRRPNTTSGQTRGHNIQHLPQVNRHDRRPSDGALARSRLLK